jgi:hypothetical protein
MESYETGKSSAADRRWAGPFRVCPACAGRNWVGARRCRKCNQVLAGVRPSGRRPVAMVGRRTSDRVFTSRLRMVASAAVVLALGGGFVTYRLLRADSFTTSPASAAVAQPEPPVGTVESSGPAMEQPLPDRQALAAGRRALDRGDVKPAVALLAEAARTLPYDAEAAHLYARALLRFGAPDRAVFQLRRAVRLAPQTDEYRVDLARALRSMGRHAEAAHVLQPASGLVAFEGDAGAAPTSATLPPAVAPPGDGVNMGGAGRGSFKGRRTFTDADLGGSRVAAPAPELSPSPAPTASPEGQE